MNKYFLLLYTILAIFIFPNCQAGNFADDPLNIPQWDGGTEAGNPPPAAVGDQPVNTRRNGEGLCPEALKNPETGLCEFIEPSSQVDLPQGPIIRPPQLKQVDIRLHPEAIATLDLSDRYRNLPILIDQDGEECVICPLEELHDTFEEVFEEESEAEFDEDPEETEWSDDSQLDTNSIRVVNPPKMIMKICCEEEEKEEEDED